MVQYGRSSRSWKESVRSSCGRTIMWKAIWEKIPNCECLFEHREKGLFLSVYVDDIKFVGKKQNLDLMWKVLNKEVDLGEPTSFLDHVYLGCTQRQCETSKDIVDNYRTMFESRISAVWIEKLPFPQNHRISSWSCDMAGRAKQSIHSTHWWPPLHKMDQGLWQAPESIDFIFLSYMWTQTILSCG